MTQNPDAEPEGECGTCGNQGDYEETCPRCRGAAKEAKARYGYVPF